MPYLRERKQNKQYKWWLKGKEYSLYCLLQQQPLQMYTGQSKPGYEAGSAEQ
jgi:hypothetical protein